MRKYEQQVVAFLDGVEEPGWILTDWTWEFTDLEGFWHSYMESTL